MDVITYTKTQDGTGAAITLEFGFKPSYVDIYNVEGQCSLHYVDTMPAGHGYKINGATQVYTSTGCVTLTENGFILGTDTDINVNGEAIHIKAGR